METEIKNDSTESKKKKGNKTIDLLKKSLVVFNTVEEKIDYLCQTYSNLYQDLKKSKTATTTLEKQLNNVFKEKDHLTKEYNKVLLQKASLENLSRELQKQKQKIQDDGIIRNRLEEEKRKEISNLFKSKISEIETQMNTYQENNEKLRHENQDLAMKLSKFLEQYEIKEQHNEKIIQTKQLENQLSEAKLKQSQCILEELTMRFKQEKDQVGKQLEDQHARVKMHEQIEEKMKEQIEFYRSKYEEFQTTLTESNQIFANCKKEMDKMTHSIKRLEKENSQYKKKWENSNYSALTLASQKAKADEDLVQQKLKTEKLENLCRALQNERSNLKKTLDETKKLQEVNKDSELSEQVDDTKRVEAEQLITTENQVSEQNNVNLKETEEIKMNINNNIDEGKDSHKKVEDTENLEEDNKVSGESEDVNNQLKEDVQGAEVIIEKTALVNVDQECKQEVSKAGDS